jgi:hypothetical protein
MLRGAAAGLGGALAMHVLAKVWERVTEGRTQDGMFGLDREANVDSIRLFWGTLEEDSAERIGYVFHYLYGAAAGAGYAWAAKRVPELRAGSGTAFGAALWVLGDEVPISVLGISNPFKKSADSHLSALGAHLVFGWVTELGIGGLRRKRDAAPDAN